MVRFYARTLLILFAMVFFQRNHAQESSSLPIRAFLIGTPKAEDMPAFLKFVREDLPKEGVNTLVLRIRYHYQWESHPELTGEDALSKENLLAIRKACEEADITLIPKMNFLGHQSERSKPFPLLAHYPQFDETPAFTPPDPYVWPNEHDYYCASYCPRHPDLHPILFDLMDELLEVTGAKAFHVGMDEVFYIGDKNCPRCKGIDPAVLYADEVRILHDHLASKGVQMWMWADRFLDGRTTGLGMWEASMNYTSRALDLIPKDIVMCDWHYNNPPPTPGYFALKGFPVLACPYNKAENALAQLNHVNQVRATANDSIAGRMWGVFQTTWTGADAGRFLKAYYGDKDVDKGALESANCFKALFAAIRNQTKSPAVD